MKGFRLRALSAAAAVVLASSALATAGAPAVLAADLSISGRVTGSAGHLGGIAINGCTTDWNFCSDTVQTDDAGNFSLGGLVAGSYVLLFQTDSTYLWGYYQGPGLIQDFSSAAPVDVTGGSVVLPDIPLTTAYWISGVVTGSAGGLSDMHVMACPIVGYSGCSAGAIDDLGSYSVGGLFAGIYQLNFTSATGVPGGALSGAYASGFYTGSSLSHQSADAANIDVTGGDVVLPTFELPLGVTITGTLSGAAGHLGDISVSASEDNFDTAAYGETHTDASGNFAVSGLWPGSYRVHIQDWSGTYVSGTYTPDGLVQSDVPHTTVGPEGLNLGIVPLETASTIRGTVTGSAGPNSSIAALACREDGLCYQGTSDDSGNFAVAGLVPGSYRLQFNDVSGTYKSGYYSDSGIVDYAFQATPLVVPPSVSGLAVTLRRADGVVRAPTAPTNVVAIAGDGAAGVTWTAPLDDGGSPIIGSIVTASDGSTCWSTTMECRVEGLTNGQSYTFTVVAQNVAGYSESSAPSDPVTPVAPPPAPVAVRLAITAAPATITAGQAVTVTVSALDQDGNVVPGYAGTVSLSSNDLWSGLPEPYAFTAEDAGIHQFSVVLGTAGPQIIGASDGVLQAGETTVKVKPGTAAIFVVSGPQVTTAGVAQRYTVTATDGYGNVATGYSGKAKIQSFDPKLAAPATVKFTKGHGTFKATFKTAGSQWLGLNDPATGAVGETFVQVDPARAARLVISGAPHRGTAGDPIAVTVTAIDRFGNVATGYTGTVRFTSNDRAAGLPPTYTFTAQDAGAHTFSVTLRTAGSRWIKVRDAVTHSLGDIARIQVIRPR